MTTVTIVAELRGEFWWPIGEAWSKDVCARFTVDRSDFHLADQTATLREAVERICNDGDSSAAPLLERDGFVEVARTSADGSRTRIRRMTLEAFPSIADYLVPA